MSPGYNRAEDQTHNLCNVGNHTFLHDLCAEPRLVQRLTPYATAQLQIRPFFFKSISIFLTPLTWSYAYEPLIPIIQFFGVFLFLNETDVVGTDWNYSTEVIPMSTEDSFH